jgi:hypothetical protein
MAIGSLCEPALGTRNQSHEYATLSKTYLIKFIRAVRPAGGCEVDLSHEEELLHQIAYPAHTAYSGLQAVK